MQKKVANNIALVATVMLVPGGFILGAALAARYYRKRLADREAAAQAEAEQPSA